MMKNARQFWGKTWKWIKRRKEQGLYNNLVKELMLEDTKGCNETRRMKYSSFEFLLANIEREREREKERERESERERERPTEKREGEQ